MGYTTPMPIQQFVIPTMIKGSDVLAISQTGMSYISHLPRSFQGADEHHRHGQDGRLLGSHRVPLYG